MPGEQRYARVSDPITSDKVYTWQPLAINTRDNILILSHVDCAYHRHRLRRQAHHSTRPKLYLSLNLEFKYLKCHLKRDGPRTFGYQHKQGFTLFMLLFQSDAPVDVLRTRNVQLINVKAQSSTPSGQGLAIRETPPSLPRSLYHVFFPRNAALSRDRLPGAPPSFTNSVMVEGRCYLAGSPPPGRKAISARDSPVFPRRA